MKKRVIATAQSHLRTTYASDYEARQGFKVREAHDEHVRTSGEAPTTKELAARLDLPQERVEELQKRARPYQLMEASFGGKGYVPFIETVIVNDQDDVLESLYLGEVEEVVKEAVKNLPEEERFVLTHRLGLGDGKAKSWEEMVKLRDGCSVSYLRKVELRAKTHLRRNVDVVKLIHRRPPSLDAVIQ